MFKQLIVISISVFFFSSSNGFAQNSTSAPSLKKSKKIIKLAEKNIFDVALLKTKAWEEFTQFLMSDSLNQLEGLDYARAFNKRSRLLPFSHFYMGHKQSVQKGKPKKNIPFDLEEVSIETVILHLRKFVADASGMMKIVEEIEAKGYKNLIIDLRNNGGGTLDAGVVLGQYLTNKPIDAGTYVTRKWYDTHANQPSKEDIDGFAYLQDMSYKGFKKIQKEAAFRMILPGHDKQIFRGKVFVLTNYRTASACEPFVHVIKTQTNATLIGQNTAGQMLSAVWFKVDKQLSVFIPTNDFITAEGTRLDQLGVAPHIETTSDEALEKALELIENNK